MSALLRTVLAAMLLGVASASPAETHRVDDSRSQVLGTRLNLKPVGPLAHGNLPSVVTGVIDVVVRLDVSPWRGRAGRIYMLLPEQAAGPVTATWSTRGRLMPGALSPGGRTLIYSGLIGSDVLEDTLRLNVAGDERRLPANPQLAFAFEIDLDSR